MTTSRLRPAMLLAAALSACSGGSSGTDAGDDTAETDTAGDTATDGADAEPDAEATTDGADGEAETATPGWQPPAEWRRPIDDYIEAVRTDMGLGLDEFDHGVKELEVFDDRLYLGYGDWTQNTGRAVGLDVRYYDDPDGDVQVEFSVDDESIDYYRIFDDVLYIPGVDATEDALVGNVYFRPSGGDWTKARTLEQNLHVIDVYAHAGALFASGGGCDDMDHYSSGEDQGVLYRSDDGGATWSIVHDRHDPNPAGVIRYEYFAGVEGNLYVFGNVIDTTSRTLTNIPRRYDDGAWTEVGLLPSAWVQRAYQLDATTAVVRGVDLGTARFRAWRVLAGEEARALGRFDSRELMPVDFFSVAPGEMLVLARDGNEYPDAAAPPFAWHVFRTTDLFALEELLAFTSETTYLCLARWNDAIYLGTADGGIHRSVYVAE